jgi:hypothetical protein
MNNAGRRSDLFRRMRRHRSSPMRSGIAVVALPRLDEKSLSRTWYGQPVWHFSVTERP